MATPDPPLSCTCATSWALERASLLAQSTALSSSLTTANAESQALARALARRRAAATTAHAVVLAAGSPHPLRLGKVSDWDSAYEELAIDKYLKLDRLVRELEDAFYEGQDKLDPPALGAIYYLASKVAHPRLAALRKTILDAEKDRFGQAVDSALGLEPPAPIEENVEATVKDSYGAGSKVVDAANKSEDLVDAEVQCEQVEIPTPAPATDPTISRTGHAQALSILQHELDGWKKLAQELQSQTQTTNTLHAYKSSYPSLSDPSPTPCAEHLTRIAQLEQDVRFRAIDADALALKNKSLSAELAQSRDCGAELREAKDEIRLVEEKAEREVARLAGEASRWREQVAGLGEKVAELEKELVVSQAKQLPPPMPIIDDDEMEMGRHCIEWIDYCISERDDEGFKKRVSELEAARVVMLRETDLPSTATWQRGVHDQRSMRREIDRLREVEKFLLDRVRKLEANSAKGPDANLAAERSRATAEIDRLNKRVRELERAANRQSMSEARLNMTISDLTAKNAELDRKLSLKNPKGTFADFDAIQEAILEYLEALIAQRDSEGDRKRVAELVSVRRVLAKDDATTPSWASFKSILSINQECRRLAAANEALLASAHDAERLEEKIVALNAELELAKSRPEGAAWKATVDQLQKKVKALEADAVKATTDGTADRQALADLKHKYHETKGRLKAKLVEAQTQLQAMLAREAHAKESWDVMAGKIRYLQARHSYVVSQSDDLLARASEEIAAKSHDVAHASLQLASQAERISDLEGALATAHPAPAQPKMDTLKTVLERNELRRTVALLTARCEEAERAKDRQTQLAVTGMAVMRNRVDEMEKVAGKAAREDDDDGGEIPKEEPTTPVNPFDARVTETIVSMDDS